MLGHGIAVALAGIAFSVRLWLADVFPPGFPFLSFFPAIILTAYFAGAGPGLVCMTLSLLAAWYFFIPPIGGFSLAEGATVPLLFFLAVSGVDVFLIDQTQRSLDGLRAERRRTAGLIDQQRTLFQELQHRTANNMAFISSLLRLQRRRIAADPALAVPTLDAAVSRIETMGRIHRRLYDPAAVDVPLDAHLQAVCDELLLATGTTNVICRVEVAGPRLDLARLVPLSLLVAEIVTNSLKHAFAGRAEGHIVIALEAGTAGECVLVIRDDGIGLPATGAGTGLGMRIVEGLARQAGGRIVLSSDGGTVARLFFDDAPGLVAA